MRVRHGPSDMLEDGLFVRYLHGELDAESERSVATHVADCDACRSRIASLEAGMRRASAILGTAAYEPPGPAEWSSMLERVRATERSRPRTTPLRMAAGWILVMAAAAALAGAPVRAWIADRWATVAGNDRGDVVAPPVQSPGTAAVTFEPSGDHLEIIVEGTQSGGTLTVRFTDDTAVGISVSNGGTEQLTWTRDRVRIANVPAAMSSWDVSVSRGVDHVSVRVAGADAIELDRDAGRSGNVEIRLQDGAVRIRPARDEH